MPRITRIYTRQGDDGTTGLGSGERVKKFTLRVEAFGTVDEVSSQIGVALATGLVDGLMRRLPTIQQELFNLGSDLCFPEADKEQIRVPVIEQRHVDQLEQILDRLTEDVGPLENFVLPGGSIGAAQLHLARTVCRRAERLVVALAEKEPVGEHTIQYLNRLSDALFVMARYENKHRGVQETTWDSRA